MKKEKNNIVHIRPVVPLDEGQRKDNRNIRRKYRKILVLILVGICTVAIAIGVYSQLTLFTNIYVVTNYEDVSVVNSSCVDFVSGFLKYGKDGVSYINYEGETIWNQPYEISNPIVETTTDCAVVADSGGNQVVVIDEEGVKGEFETYLPIEKVTVSNQGIVAVLMNDGISPQIICYDAVGNILIEHKSTITGTGYPTGVAFSENGETLLVTYLQVTETGINSNYVYYSFSNSEQVTQDVIAEGSKSGVVIPEAEFLASEISVIISNESMSIFKGIETVELVCEVAFDKELESVFYGNAQIGLIFKDTMSDTKELRVYNTSGNVMFSTEIIGEYESISIVNNQIILYEKENCIIYSLFGVEKYNGTMNTELSGVFPVFGINKYVIIGSEGMQKVRLTR